MIFHKACFFFSAEIRVPIVWSTINSQVVFWTRMTRKCSLRAIKENNGDEWTIFSFHTSNGFYCLVITKNTKSLFVQTKLHGIYKYKCVCVSHRSTRQSLELRFPKERLESREVCGVILEPLTFRSANPTKGHECNWGLHCLQILQHYRRSVTQYSNANYVCRK